MYTRNSMRRALGDLQTDVLNLPLVGDLSPTAQAQLALLSATGGSPAASSSPSGFEQFLSDHAMAVYLGAGALFFLAFLGGGASRYR